MRDLNKANINADVTAAFLGAGIPLDKVDHPSIRGFLKKYTTVHGSIRNVHELRKDGNVNKVLNEHIQALKAKLVSDQQGKVVYVMFDEWLDCIGARLFSFDAIFLPLYV